MTPERRKEIQQAWYLRQKAKPEYKEYCRANARRYRERHKDEPAFRERQRAGHLRQRAKSRTPEEIQKTTQYKADWQRKRRLTLTETERAERNKRKREWARAERANNPEGVRAREKRLREQKPSYKLSRTLRCRLWHALRGKARKVGGVLSLVGCTAEQLREHIEAQFLPGMTWENYNRTGWHVDHIKPCSSFNLTDPDQQRACFHYSNLRPLWAADNQRKYNK